MAVLSAIIFLSLHCKTLFIYFIKMHKPSSVISPLLMLVLLMLLLTLNVSKETLYYIYSQLCYYCKFTTDY